MIASAMWGSLRFTFARRIGFAATLLKVIVRLICTSLRWSEAAVKSPSSQPDRATRACAMAHFERAPTPYGKPYNSSRRWERNLKGFLMARLLYEKHLIIV